MLGAHAFAWQVPPPVAGPFGPSAAGSVKKGDSSPAAAVDGRPPVTISGAPLVIMGCMGWQTYDIRQVLKSAFR